MVNKIPTDPNERKAYFQALGSKGGKSERAARPFRDVQGLAKKAGSKSGYTFKRNKQKVEKESHRKVQQDNE